MSVKTHPFGHPKARKFIKGEHIPHQKAVLKGDTLEQAAMVSVIADAFQGRGPLSKPLKDAAKSLVEKFEKSNPDFKFSKFSRDRSKSSEAPTKSSKSKPEKAKPSKTGKKADAKSKPSKKASKKSTKEPALAGAE